MANRFSVARALRGGIAIRSLALLGASGMAMIVAAPAVAQDFTTGALVGRVLDASGQPVTGGTLTARSAAQGFERTVPIASNGTFRVQALPGGEYVVTVNPANGEPIENQRVSITPGGNSTYTFRPAAAVAAADAMGPDIVVTGSAERGTDFGNNTGGLALGDVSQLLNTTPIARNQTAIQLLAPGTTAGDSAFGNLASFSGATVAENQYYVNGLNITNFRNFLGSNNPPIEFYESIDVKTFGLPAEYGRALGGFTTVTTKSGSNNFKAGAIVAYSPDALRDDSPNTYAALNERDYAEDLEANFYLSGPIIKDRLFFYALYNPNYEKQSDISLTSNQQITRRSNSPFFGGKIDAIITDGHRLEGTYFRNKRTDEYSYYRYNPTSDELGGYIGTAVDEQGGDNFVATYTGQFTDWLTLSASYGENHDDRSSQPSLNVALVQSTLTGITTTERGFQGNAERSSDVRKFYRADADVYVNLLGTHHFRFGYEREDLTSTEDTLRAGGYSYILTPGYIERTFYQNAGEWNGRNEAFYIQDNWTLLDDRLTLQLGLRNDKFSNNALDGNTYFRSGDQWGPRIGASFDVFGDNRTAVFGSWNRYFMPVATNTSIRLGGAEMFYRQRFAYSGAGAPGTGLVYDNNGNIQNLGPVTGGIPCPELSADSGSLCSNILSDGVQGPIDTLVSSSLAPSYTDEWNIGVSHRIGDWSFRLTYLNRRLGRTLDDVAIDAAVLAYCDENGINGCDSVFTGFHQYVLANPGEDITVRLDGDCAADPRQCEVATLSAANLGYPTAVRNYDSVQFEFEKAYSNNWYLRGSYVYQRLRGNYEGAVKSDNGQADAGLTQDFDQPGLLDGAYGQLANGREHQFKLFGSYGITDNFRIGANILVESPRKFSCIGTYYDFDNFAAAYQDASFYCAQPQFNDRPAFTDPATGRVSYLVDRGTAFESDWRKQIDVNAQVDIPELPGSFFSIDVFNVFNWKSKVDYQEFGELSDASLNERYGEVLGYQAPRSVRLTFGVRLGENR
ncbi:TonB-dependent receptor domain-containing protein [Sphingomonas sp. IW22]|uniref:TonB-dependent receptor n=1 Tax=Sphingomonas sp. IW22 TaxID=3242489 RepID=UPI00351FD96C